MKSKLFPAIATLTGTAMGAGFLGMPYVIARAGFVIGLAYIILIGLIMMFVNLYLGEIALRTKEDHQLTGYAERYLGSWGKWIMFFAMLFGIYSALIAYLIGQGESLSFLFFGNTSYSLIFGFLFWLFMSFLVYKGLRMLKKGESIGLILVLVLIFFIFFFFVGKINLDNLTYFNKEFLFLPFGVVLFSFLAFSVLPELEFVLKGQENKMRKAIVIGSLIPIFVYSIFTFVIVGSLGLQVPEIATLALGKIFIFLGMITMFTAFFALSSVLRDMYRLDFHFTKKKAWLAACIVPLILFVFIQIFDLVSFTQILALGGIISGGLTGILILLMIREAKKQGDRKPEYSLPLNWILILLILLLFLVGVFIEIFV